MKHTSEATKGFLLALAVGLLQPGWLEAQTAAPGWTLTTHATNVSTVSGGEALAADLATGDLFVRSLQDPGGFSVQLARVTPDKTVTILATLPAVQNSDVSGIAIDPLAGGIIVADEIGGAVFGRIARIDLSTAPPTVSTLFPLNWDMNPHSNGTGQQQYAADPANPSVLYFWDSTFSKLFRLDRSTSVLAELLALDQATPPGQHSSTYANDIVFDPGTGRLLLTDGSSHSVLDVDPTTTPPAVTTLFSGVSPTPHAIAFNPDTGEIFIAAGFNSIFVGPRAGGSLSLVASGFPFLADITVGHATAGSGRSLFAVDKALDTVYEITPTPPVIRVALDIKPGSFPNSINPRSQGKIPVAILTTDTFDATTVDATTVRFGKTATEAAAVHVALEDVDLDGDIDMILHFNTRHTGIVCGDTAAFLTGKTLGGQTVQASDSVRTVGCR